MWYKIKLTIAVLALTLFGNISAETVTPTERNAEIVIAQLF